MPRLAEKLLVMLWAAAGQGASCPVLWRANADVGETNSCCSCTQCISLMHASAEIGLCEDMSPMPKPGQQLVSSNVQTLARPAHAAPVCVHRAAPCILHLVASSHQPAPGTRQGRKLPTGAVQLCVAQNFTTPATGHPYPSIHS